MILFVHNEKNVSPQRCFKKIQKILDKNYFKQLGKYTLLIKYESLISGNILVQNRRNSQPSQFGLPDKGQAIKCNLRSGIRLFSTVP